GITNDGASEGLAWKFIERQGSRPTRPRVRGVHLRNRDVDSKSAGRHHVKEFPWLATGTACYTRSRAASTCARIDQRSNICVAGGNDSVKRGVDFFEGLQLLQPAHVGGIGFQSRLHCLQVD